MADDAQGSGAFAVAPGTSQERHASKLARRGQALLREGLVPSLQQLIVRWSWLRHWELWLALCAGTFLRLWHLGQTQFLDDQMLLMSMARDSVLSHALPVTGIPSSIHTLNPPLSVYLLLPFALFSKDPFPAVVGLALWNVVGVALCYVFTLRYFGRRAAAIATLVFATSGAATSFSRFIWQQNYLPPFIMIWAMAMFAGCARGRRGWLPLSAACLVIGAMLHPTALLLSPALVAAWILAPRRPSIREHALTAAVVVALLAPTLVWEGISGLSDVHLFRQFASAPTQTNLDVFQLWMQVLGPPTFPFSNPGSTFSNVLPSSPYDVFSAGSRLVWLIARAVYIASYIILTGLVAVPVVRYWRASSATSIASSPGQRASACWHALRADSIWCAHLLLWLAITCVPLAMIRHSNRLHAHYLLVLYPLIFIMAGIGMDWVPRLIHMVAARVKRPGAARMARALRLTGTAGVLALVAVLIAGQAIQMGLYIQSQAAGQVDDSGYGYPLGELRDANAALDAIAQRQGAHATYIGAPVWYTHNALSYMLVREHPGRLLFYGDCLMLPPGDGPSLVVSTYQASWAASLLPRLPNARFIRSLAMPGNEPFAVYRVEGATPRLPAEKPVAGVVFRDVFGNVLRLDGVALAGSGTLLLRWTVLSVAPALATPPHFSVDVRAVAQGVDVGSPVAHVECDPSSWQTGATLFTWASPANVNRRSPNGDAFVSNGQPTSTEPLPQTVAISAWSQTVSYTTPVLGPLRLLTYQLVTSAPAQLQAITTDGGAIPPGMAITPTGELVFPLPTLQS